MGKRNAKRKGMRRAYLKAYSSSFISTGRGPNTEVIKEYAQRARYVDQYLVKLFGLDKPSTNNIPRQDAVKSLERLLEETPPERHVCLKHMPSEKIFLFYNGTGTQYFFIKCVFSVFLKSIIYSDRDTAMQRYTQGRVVWIERNICTNSQPPALAGAD